MAEQLQDSFGAEGISRMLDSGARARLDELVNGFLQNHPPIPDFASGRQFNDPDLKAKHTGEQIAHAVYERQRADYQQMATIAGISSHPQLDKLIDGWAALQRAYALFVRRNISQGKQEQEKDITVYDDELRKGEQTREELRTINMKTGVQLTDQDLERLPRLRRRVKELDDMQAEKDKISRAVAGIDMTVRDMQTLAESPGNAGIHYRIFSIEDTRKQLGEGTYDGPAFEPFRIGISASISDIFSRTRSLEPLPTIVHTISGGYAFDLSDLPPTLCDLLFVKRWLAEQPLGTRYRSGDVSERIGEKVSMGAKGIGGYLERASQLFGVTAEKAGSARVFTRRETGQQITDEQFLEAILEHLQPGEQAEANHFYLLKAFTILRENPRGYEGFGTAAVDEIVRQKRFPITDNKTIGINIHRYPEKYGIRLIRGEKREREYIFSKVILTENQLRYAREAIPELGYGQIGPQQLIEYVQKQQNVRLAEPVAEALFTALADELNLVKIGRSGCNYRRKDRPPTADEVLEQQGRTPAKLI